jgi:hypothetical protein
LSEAIDQRSGVAIDPPPEHDLVADAAVADNQDAIGMGRGASVVRDEHDRLA